LTQGRKKTQRRNGKRAGALPALQARSQEKRDRLLQAGLQVFGELGYDAARVADIAKAADISVGVFYQRFTDKRALFAALEDEFVDRSAERTARFLAKADSRWTALELFERLLSNMADVMKRNVGFFRALVSLAHRDSSVIGPGLTLDRRNAEMLHEYLVKRRLIGKAVGLDDVLFGIASVSKVLLVHTLMRGDSSRAGAAPDTERLARMLARYLGIDG
jgi:AcrR family transcriptional regulator